MKIAVTGPDYFNYTSSVAWAAGELGHETALLPFRNFEEQCGYLRLKLVKAGLLSGRAEYEKKWNRDFLAALETFQPELLIVLNGDWLKAETLQHLKKRGIRLKLWLIDSIKRMVDLQKLLACYDSIHVFEPGDRELIRFKFGLTAHYLPVGYDPRIYRPRKERDKDIDICFVGGATAKRVAILQQVAAYAAANDKKMVVYGKYWDDKYFWKKRRFANKYEPLSRYIKNERLPPEKVAELYSRSKICLNIHIEEHDGPNPRIFEILATNSFQLVDIKKELPELVKIGDDLETYETQQELIAKIEYYLQRQSEADAIAQSGFEYVQQEHDIVKKVANLLLEG